MKKIPPPLDPIRVDKYVSQQLNLSREEIKKCIKNGTLLVNGNPVKSSDKVTENDEIIVTEIPPKKDLEIKKEKQYIEMLYEDKEILVINKPSGLIVHPGPRQGTLVNGLLYYPGILSDGESDDRPGIVHRLDQFTDGVMIIAKTNKAHAHLKKQFQERSVKKKYFAMIKGSPKWENIVITKAIGRHPKKRNRMTTHQIEGVEMKDAKTTVRVLKRYNTKTLVEAVPETGRTHQIRVHLSANDHPVIGDSDYSKAIKQNNYLLQAYYIRFQHPTKSITLSFKLNGSKRILL